MIRIEIDSPPVATPQTVKYVDDVSVVYY